MRRTAASGLAALLLACLFAVPAQAQERIHSTTLDAFIDGKGALQAQVNTSTDREFDPQNQQIARAGLEIVGAAGYSPVDDPNRVSLSGPTVAGSVATSSYRASGLEITEKATVTNGSHDLSLEYTIVNPGQTAVVGRAAALGVAGRDARSVTPGTSVGVRDHLGRRVLLVQDTPWQHHEVGVQAFQHFQDGGLNDTDAGGFARHAVGAQWNLNLAANGGQQVIRVSWRFDPGIEEVTVNSTVDADDGTCDAANCTLREAVSYVRDEMDIHVPAGTFHLTSELKSRSRDVRLTGQGARTTIIDGDDNTRLLNVLDGELNVAAVTFTGGNGDPNDDVAPFARGFAAGRGGAILVGQDARLELRQVAVVDNATLGIGQSGGGIAGDGAILVENSVIARNRAADDGGGIAIFQAAQGDSVGPGRRELDDRRQPRRRGRRRRLRRHVHHLERGDGRGQPRRGPGRRPAPRHGLQHLAAQHAAGRQRASLRRGVRVERLRRDAAQLVVLGRRRRHLRARLPGRPRQRPERPPARPAGRQRRADRHARAPERQPGDRRRRRLPGHRPARCPPLRRR